MLPLVFNQNHKPGYNLLCIGAHCDDIEIGCGGTILKLIQEYTISSVKWVVFTSNEIRAAEAKESASHFLQDVQTKEVTIHQHKDGFLPYLGYEIKSNFEDLKKDFVPDIILTHYRNDRHQDHRLISDLTWNTFRNHFILEYEIPKYDGDLGNPNFFVPLSAALVDKKVDILLQSFSTQASKHWFDRETFVSLMRIRGIESASDTKYAEAFHARKISFY
jgi:LmbE family N-acetylglucosaminyl deacetylase